MKSFALPILAIFLLAGILAAGQDFTGTWIGKTEVTGGESDDLTLVIQKNVDPQTKAVTYSVVFTDTLGYAPPGTEVREVKVEGAEISFRFTIVNGVEILGKLTLKDDTLVGAWASAEGEGAVMSFERKK